MRLLALISAACLVCSTTLAADRPNIILVVADDLGAGDLHCFGHPEIRSPNLDKLAAQGLKLTQCYSAAANCSPARAALMTGRVPYRVGIYNQISFMAPFHLRPAEVSVAKLLQQAGYATGHFGKWHLNGLFNLPGQPQPDDHGFDYWFSVQNNALPNHHNPYNFVRNGIPQGPLIGYSGQLVANEAIGWLTTLRDKSKPFFMYVCFNEPHEPIATDPQYAAPYRDKHADDPSTVAYYGNVTQMDASLGRILVTLDQSGLADNTLIWFTSDNGPARTRWHNAGSTGGLREYKGHMYEGGLRVPGIVRWPGHIAPGTVSDQPVSGVDFLPTICNLTSIPAPADRVIDGSSIAPLFTGQSVTRALPLHWEFYWAASPPQLAMRDGDWKLLASYDGPRSRIAAGLTDEQMHVIKSAPLTRFELYNLKDDPTESTDLAASDPARVAALRAKLETVEHSVQHDGPVWPAFEDDRFEQKRIIWPDYVAKPLPNAKPKAKSPKP